MSELHYTHVDAASWAAQSPALLAQLFPLHQSLRPHFQEPEAYARQLERVLRDHAHLLLAWQAQTLAGLALYRMHHNTYQHKLFFLEDLVVAETVRGQDIGSQILQACEDLARRHGCHYLSLDSGTFRTRAHKFYYRHNYVADCFHFSKQL